MTTDPQTDRFRRRTEIEARQWTGSNADAMSVFCSPFDFQTIDPEDRVEDPDQTAAVRTHPHGGWVGLKPGDWVVREAGRYTTASDEEFRADWEPVAAAVPVAAPPTTEQEARRERIAALFRHPPGVERLGDATPGEIADAVLAELFGPVPAGTDIATWTAIRAIQLMNEASRQRDAVLPAPADRAAVFQEAADAVENDSWSRRDKWGRYEREEREAGFQQAADLIRRLADEEQAGGPSREATEPQPEPTAEEIARANVLALHQIGEQLAGIESWMWEYLADVRDTAKPQQDGAADDHSCAESGCSGEPQPEEAAPPREPHPTEADLHHALAVLARFHGRDDAGPAAPETVHACPPDGSGVTPCCGRTPFELPRTDRISSEATAVTCAPAVSSRPGTEQEA